MKKVILASMLALSLTSAFANEGDLTLPGERWAAKFTAFVCADGNTQTAGVPADFAERNVVFGKATTDMSLDNLLVRATFVENGVTCNYSALLFADNAAWTVKLVDSKAYSANNESSCLEGKKFLDSALADNKYKYLHGRAAIYVPATDADVQCSAEESTVGLHFQVTGKIQ
ncbi:hypothetical protein DOM21_04140 [Bacteriovorax stolpii]|uniref:Uncharacterized protein n=1 Tax=Bacteriovorax stolpii TaxID=960 RepID=A0A2K9NV17_BACTC|nr:hypothetical protein [Bacteriovorax stolpii]AUN99363.1 hypothetical protein C0V70_14865 [Bacteriovorax stolpii]QDK40657.1 hypothetical protein DOM21_04140 [Bacteriovorax stolpii]TDP55096.1 hypothetical protein C8D79_0138 [Bacteriovorax stolpii]